MKIYTDNVFDWATCSLESACAREYAGGVVELKGSAPPPPPDPKVVSEEQIKANRDNSAYNNAITHGNTSTPLGNQTYTGHKDPVTGAMVYDQAITLAPDQQKLLDLQNQQSLHLGGTADRMLSGVDAAYGSAMPKSNYSWNDLNTARQQVQDALYKRQSSYLDPQFKQQSDALNVQLHNEGLTPGSEPWNVRMDQLGREKAFNYGQARNSAIAGSLGEMQGNAAAAGQQLSQALALRNQPLNEYNALRAGSQVNMPQFSNAQNAQSANTDTAGNQWNAYSGNLNAWNANQQSSNAMMNGVMGLGGQLGSAKINSKAGA